MKIRVLLLPLLAMSFVACSTTGKFKIPKNSQLFIEDFEVGDEGERKITYKRSPFFWNVAGGIPYRLEKKGEVIDEGTIKSRFRPASIFWPPFGIIYWPMGFGKQTYDFTKRNGLVRPKRKRSRK